MTDPVVADLDRAERQRRIWRALGITVAVVVSLAGLVMVGLIIFYVIAINAWASNK